MKVALCCTFIKFAVGGGSCFTLEVAVVPMEKARRVRASKKRKRAEEVDVAVVEKARTVQASKKRERAEEGERHSPPPRKQRERSK